MWVFCVCVCHYTAIVFLPLDQKLLVSKFTVVNQLSLCRLGSFIYLETIYSFFFFFRFTLTLD
jgi:hypothetical protein